MNKDDRQIDLFGWADSRPTAQILDFFDLALAPRLSRPEPFYGAYYETTQILPLRRTA